MVLNICDKTIIVTQSDLNNLFWLLFSLIDMMLVKLIDTDIQLKLGL
jgi:hypothetical protein